MERRSLDMDERKAEMAAWWVSGSRRQPLLESIRNQRREYENQLGQLQRR
jgi:hypothetical protein